MGYGMMIIPLMAGYDPDAKKYFDGLFRYYKAHPSSLTPNLMAWKQITGCVNADGDDSASDGDIDIAFGLLLAHEQWGSSGDIDYLHYAKLIIKDLMGNNAKEGDINQDLNTVKLGDWVSSGSYMNSTRTSDFITDHFRAFACVADDSLAWMKVVDRCYGLVADMQENYSPQTGLLPDFIVNTDGTPQPAPPDFLEGKLDGHYSYNACRDPWRLGTDYLLNGDNRALNAVKKINNWLYEETGGDAGNIFAGYYLNGTKAADWNDVSFTAPFAVGAMTDTTKQDWLNSLYDEVLSSVTADNGYYGNTLKLLSMLVISGNYRVPQCEVSTVVKKYFLRNKDFTVYPSITSGTLNISFTSNTTRQKTKIKIINMTGSVILEQTIDTSGNNPIDLSSFPAGIYLISLFSKDGQLKGVRKVILR